MDRVERVRQILSSRGLTLYRVSQQSAEIFGHASRFYVPHNLYYNVASPSLIPTIWQMLALSHITGYRLSDWLAVFGFDLDLMSCLRLRIHSRRTTPLDSSVYDTHAWIPWFADRILEGPVPPVAPLRQLLAEAAPKRAAEIVALNKRKFLYAKVGEEDALAFPYLAHGSIVRADARRAEEFQSDPGGGAAGRLFLVEHSSGWACSQLRVLARDRILLHSPHRPCAQTEFRLGREARVLGVIDAEICPAAPGHSARIPARTATPRKVQPRLAPSPQSNLRNLLRNSRLRVGLSFREASSASRGIANRLSDELYFAAASTLSDYETLSEPPRHIQKVISLCVLYCIDFQQLLRSSGLPLDREGRDPMPDDLVSRQVPRERHGLHGANEEESFQEQRGFLGSLLEHWEEIPLFLRHSLDEITGLRNFSFSDVFWVGGERAPLHPLLANATFVAVNRRIKKPSPSAAKVACGQPPYLILKRDGSYFCGRCTLEGGDLVIPAFPGYPGGTAGTQRLRNGVEAEVIGQVTTIARRLAI